jgi:serine/threonine-protein kinase
MQHDRAWLREWWFASAGPDRSTAYTARVIPAKMSQPTWACPTCQTPLPSMASFCYVCGTATPAGLNKHTGEVVATARHAGIGPADLIRKLQRALGPGYQLLERIGAGGFAEVYHARDLRLKRDLAVKVLRPDLGLSPELLQRFRREAETIATLRNPHIVPVYDIGEAQGLAFIIMPLISGESLRAALDRDGAMPATEVRRILREAALGLAAAHEAGVIHRDIKPENIMLEGRQKRVLLMDFGIAKAMGLATDSDPGTTLTTTGIIIGTPQYMSPEQAAGDKSIDARSDQYSLAVVGYRMLAGELPFGGDSTRAVLYQQLVATPPAIQTKVAGVPAGLAHAITRAMAKEPAERFADMIEFAAMLDNDAPPGMSEPTTEMPVVSAKPAHRRGLMVAGALAVALLLAAGCFISRRQPAPPAPPAVLATPAAPPAAPPAQADTVARPATSPAPVAAGTALPSRPAAPKPAPKEAAANRARIRPAAATAAPAPTCAKAAASGDWAAAATACLAEANSGSAPAQRILGTMYDHGNGVAASPVDAVSWYRRAAASNDAEAEFLLSQMLDVGRGTAQSAAESAVHLRLAASGGWLRAQQVLAYRLENGTGVRKSEDEAAAWYRRAAERGDAISQQKLADFLAKGRGVRKDETEALDWYRKAADQGSGGAAWQAAQMYFKGRGTARNDSAGMDWLRRAAALNQPDAVKELKKRTPA